MKSKTLFSGKSKKIYIYFRVSSAENFPQHDKRGLAAEQMKSLKLAEYDLFIFRVV